MEPVKGPGCPDSNFKIVVYILAGHLVLDSLDRLHCRYGCLIEPVLDRTST